MLKSTLDIQVNSPDDVALVSLAGSVDVSGLAFRNELFPLDVYVQLYQDPADEPGDYSLAQPSLLNNQNWDAQEVVVAASGSDPNNLPLNYCKIWAVYNGGPPDTAIHQFHGLSNFEEEGGGMDAATGIDRIDPMPATAEAGPVGGEMAAADSRSELHQARLRAGLGRRSIGVHCNAHVRGERYRYPNLAVNEPWFGNRLMTPYGTPFRPAVIQARVRDVYWRTERIESGASVVDKAPTMGGPAGEGWRFPKHPPHSVVLWQPGRSSYVLGPEFNDDIALDRRRDVFVQINDLRLDHAFADNSGAFDVDVRIRLAH